jgi:undecaprenyl-diphosphatase
MRAVFDRICNSTALRITGGFALAALSLALLGWLVTGPYRSFPAELDVPIRSYVRQLQSPMLTSLFLAVTKLGSTLYLGIIGSVAGLAFIVLRWFRPLVLFLIAIAGQSVLHNGFKFLIARPRPSPLINVSIGESLSFPSGHALSGFCFYVSLSWLLTNRMENSAATAGTWIFALTLVFLIGLSRIYIGIHYATDVFAGFIAAAIWTAAVLSTDRKVM